MLTEGLLFYILVVFIYLIVFFSFENFRKTWRRKNLKSLIFIARHTSSQKIFKYYLIAKNNLVKSFFLLLISVCFTLPGLMILFETNTNLIINTVIAFSGDSFTKEESIFILLLLSIGSLIIGLFILRLFLSSIINFLSIRTVVYLQKRLNNG